MSTEVTTMDLTRAIRAVELIRSTHAERTHQPRHRHPHHTDHQALLGVAVLLAVGAAGMGVVLHLVGAW